MPLLSSSLRLISAVGVLFFALPALPAVEGDAGEARGAVILHWNDFHGQVRPRVRSSGERQGGIRAIARFVTETREKESAERVLLLDAGDWFQGTPEGNLTRGTMIVDLWNSLGVSAAVVGNHDFDLGEPNLMALCRRARFPILGANVVDDAGATRSYLKATALLEAGGIRFGIIGLLTPRTPQIVIQDIGKGLRVDDAARWCRRLIPELRAAGAECIVVLSHLGYEPERELADRVEGIDLIVGGHSHTPLLRAWRGEQGTVVTQAGCKGQYVGRIDVRRQDGKFVFGSRLFPMVGTDEPVAPAIETIIRENQERIDAVMGEVVGELPTELEPPPRGSPSGSSPLGNWLCDVMAHRAGVKIALHNRGGIRDRLPRGPVTVRDLFQVSPFGNEVVICEVRGADLEAIVVRSLAESEVRLEVSGLTVHWRRNGDGEGELVRCLVGEEPLDREKVYRLATNSYLATGGDGWSQFEAHAPLVSVGIGVFEASMEAMRARDRIAVSRENRFPEEKGKQSTSGATGSPRRQ